MMHLERLPLGFRGTGGSRAATIAYTIQGCVSIFLQLPCLSRLRKSLLHQELQLVPRFAGLGPG